MSAIWSPDLLKTRVYDAILTDIVLGVLAPGLRLDEQALAGRYDAGLAGVRDALGRLALEGMVVRRPRAGTTVAPIDMLELRQAFEVRRMIEPYCAGQAAAHGSAEDHEAIRAAYAGVEAADMEDARELVVRDTRFHVAVAVASRNASLARTVIELHHKTTRFWVHAAAASSEEERRHELALHKAVADAILRRDVRAATEAMRSTVGGWPDRPVLIAEQAQQAARACG